MLNTTIVMTHDDYNRLRGLLERIPGDDRRYYLDLKRELERAQRVEPSEIPPDVVTMNSTVHLRELDSDELWTFTVCFPTEADIREDRISILSPVGTAIIGCRTGDIVDWPVPSGHVRIRIERVVYQPEADGATSTSSVAATIG